MEITKKKHISLEGKYDKPILVDVFYKKNDTHKPIVIFAHGFKGFKDWGCWNRIGEMFAKAGIVFIKFNFSYNGTSPAAPLDFVDLDAFGQNNYTKELADLDIVLEHLLEKETLLPITEFDKNKLTLIGHSRGGGIAILKAQSDSRIHKLITWAAVASLDYAWQHSTLVEQWKQDGVYYILNGRTKQQMPLYYQLYEDFIKNKEAYTIEQNARQFKKPFLIVHGTKDPAVPVFCAELLHEWSSTSKIHLIEDADHVFGAKHPYEGDVLPKHSLELLEVCIDFIHKNNN